MLTLSGWTLRQNLVEAVMKKSHRPHPLPTLHTRRSFLRVALAGGAGGILIGCVTNPVTGKRQFMLLSEDDEIKIDQEHVPHQFSEDFGKMPLPEVNRYLDDMGQRIAATTHRPHMPYSFQAVNASHTNAYAFPGGTIACTRGILLGMESEAQLAGLLGHELAHVNARHSASRMSTGMLVNLALVGATIAVSARAEKYTELVTILGGLGAGLLLARYSRANERQADDLGMEYMVKSEYNPEGMIRLMQMLVDESGADPNALAVMFSTHPMSSERLRTARSAVQGRYAEAGGLPMNRDRYMDGIAPLRAQAATVAQIRNGDAALGKRNLPEAERRYAAALKERPDDYEALIKMAYVLRLQNRAAESKRFAQLAKQAYPGEPQANTASGLASLALNRFSEAHAEFAAYQKALPGNPSVSFYNGLALDGMGRKQLAAQEYQRYLNAGASDAAAAHAVQRLQTWGMMPKEGG